VPDNRLLPEPAADRAALRRDGIEPLPDRTGRLALSFAQQRLWFLSRLAGVSEAYHVPLAVALTGPLDRAALIRALDALVARHEALRTHFVTVAGEAFGRLDLPDRGFALRFDDLSGEPDPDARLAGLQDEEATASFDLEAGPLVRGRLVRLAADRYVLLVTFHHIVSDGWSMGVFTRELGALYTAFQAGHPDPLPPLSIQYADYAAWQRRWLAGGVAARQGGYWKQALAGAPALLELPTDRPRPAEQDYRGDLVRVEFDAELTARLKALSQRHGVTLFMTLLAAWGLVLSRLSGQDDVVVGTPTANRRRAELDGLIGFFVNTLAVRVDLSGAPTVTQLLGRVRDVTLTALDHQDMPFEQVVELLNPARSLAYTPLFQAMFAWQNNEEGNLALPGVTVTPIRSSYAAAKFDLNLVLAEDGDRIAGNLGYATALFDADTARRYVRYLHRVLTQMVADAGRPAGAVALVDEAERRQRLAGSDATAGYPAEQPIHSLFEAHVARTPDAVAVVDEGRSLTYRELDACANRLAHHLRRLGVGPDQLVAVCLDRCLDLVVGLLAVLKAGGAYLPLDPANPAERLSYMIDDAAPVLLLTHAATRAALPTAALPAAALPAAALPAAALPAAALPAAALPAAALPAAGRAGRDLPILDLDADRDAWAGWPADAPPDSAVTASHLAYVIYTSGSTGRPKGVMVEHASVLRLLAATEKWFHFGADDVWTLFHSVAFDFSVWEIWGALGHGGRLVVVPQLTSRSPADFYQLLGAHGVTVLNQTPSAFRGLVAAQAASGAPHRLRTVIFGGEAFDPAMLRPWYADARNAGTDLVNMYGITETTVHVTYRPLTSADTEQTGPSPIGRPLDDLRVYVLDERREPVPPGVVGELYVGGAGVARGYLNRPELTTQRFTESPFVAGDRLYRTGDLARYRADGDLEYVGRNDFQVKIRGFRIELGEIEARLATCPGVRDAVVLARHDAPGDARLVGYYIAEPDAAPAPERLRAELAAVLPDHMVPAAYVRVEVWPLTANGKLDRGALPAPDDAALGTRRYDPPRGLLEQALASIWAEVLGVERVGRHDHFFALGGHSLLALRVLDRMRRQGMHADVRALFGTPTLAALAAAVGTGPALVDVPPNRIPAGCARLTPDLLPLLEMGQDEIDAVVATVPGGAANVADLYPLAPVQEGILFHHLMASGDDPYLVESLIRFDDRGRLDAYRAALEAVIARHDVLRTAVVWQGVSEPVQVVWREAPLPVTEVTLDPAGADPGSQLRAHFLDRQGRRMPLDRAPLLRLLVARDPADGRWYALELTHHIIDDNTSLKQLGAEIRAHLAGRAGELPPPVPFRDFIARTRQGPDRAEHEAFFREMLGDVDVPTAPFGLTDINGDGRSIRQSRRRVDSAVARSLRARALDLGVTAASLFHVAWGQVLARACGRSDVVFGTVLFGRMQGVAGSDRALGPFINTLPLRVTLGATGARECVRRTHAALVGLLRHEHASLALAQRASAVAPPSPLFSALLNYRHTARAAGPGPDPAAGPDTGMTYLAADERGNYPLALDVDDQGDGFRLTVVAGGDVDPEAVAAMVDRALAALADALHHAPDTPIGRLDVLPSAERDRLIAAGDGGTVGYPRRRLLHQLFEAQAARDPHAVAVADHGTALSYGQLNVRANRLAHHLRTRGVGPDRPVAICVERSAEMVVGMLAVLKAGGAYLPLDPSYPTERLTAMLGDSAPVVVLTHERARAALAPALAAVTAPPPVIDLVADAPGWDGEPETTPLVDDLAPDHIAYVIYTSGTTGAPNGVLVEHRHLVAIAAAWERSLGLRAGLTHLQMASLSFDVCTADLVRALGFGGRLVLCPRELLADEAGLYALIRRQHVDFADFVPTVLVPLMAHVESVGGTLAGFETLICGSEAWTPADARRARALCGPGARIVNAYGVTEAAVDSSHYLVPAAGPAGSTRLPIGRPLPGVRLYLLDDAGELVPDGATGEIHIGGAGVARGYLNRPELTARRFVTNPFVVGDRLYRTGDLGRRRPDGEVEFLGRRDFQVKIRGLRVELAEIEAALTSVPGVREAVVTAAASGRLVAYYLAGADPAPDTGELRDRLAAMLPGHMVPAAYVRLDAWPLTPNGKLDRAALPAPDAGPRGYAEPVGPMEAALAPLWAQVLGVDQVGRYDDFFALGGHSLSAMRLVAAIRRALGREASPAAVFDAPTLAGLARRLEAAGGEMLPPIEPAMRSGPLPASFAQQRLWFLAQMEGASDAYHMPQAWQLTGALDAAALARAWDALVARHEALRVRFVAVDGAARQLLDPAGPALRADDLSGEPDPGARLDRLRREEATAPFDLAAGPLARGRLVRLAWDRHVLLVTLHHIVSDGWSMDVFTRELGVLYTAFLAGRPGPLPPLPVQYADYAAWQRAWLAGSVLDRQGAFWTRTLDGAPAELELPADRPRPAEQDYRGGQVRFELAAELTAGLRELSRRHGGTVFMTLLAAWALVLSRLSGQDDVVIGTPTANRRRDELAGLIGFFVNTLALRVDLSGTPTVAQLLRRARDVTLAALDHQDIPFEQVVELLNPARSLGRTPLFQTMLTWQDDGDAKLTLADVTAVPLGAPYLVAKFDLTLSLAANGERLVGALNYATAVFDASTARRYVRYLHRVLAQMVADPDRAAAALALTDGAERGQLLGWGAGRDARPRALQELFQARAAQAPDTVAVVFEGRSVTYGELNARANRLAYHLRSLGVGPDARVAICMRRSPEMVVGLTAILKAGGAYVPIDPAYPGERVAFMLADSAPVLLLTEAGLRGGLSAGLTTPVLCPDRDEAAWAAAPDTDPPVIRHPDHLAYVIYTSGSTGWPKGVAQTWRCADNLVDWMLHDATPDSSPPARVLQFASTSFDVSFQEVWSTLCAGATLVLMAEERRADLGELRRFIAEQDVQRAFLPAAVLQQIAVLGDATTPRPRLGCEIVTAGEALRITGDVRALVAHLGGDRLYNHYGPTETHAATGHTLVVPDASAWPALPPIGRPIPGARIYLLDCELAPVPVGVVGEVYIGGAGLARGYLGRPAMTAGRFLPDPFAGPGARMYRSGDLARFRPDGTIDYIGRADGQVKIRGFRVEPGEVEAVLQQIDGVREAAVLVRGDAPADRHLVGYVAGDATVEEVRERSRLRLPDHMVPARWVRLDRLPLTPNGKLNRRALPAPGETDGGPSYLAPRTPREAAMAAIWAQILRRERVGVYDDFFALGGHSLLATQLVHAINQRMSARLSLRDLFRTPVLADLAAHLGHGDGDEAAAYVFPPLTPDPAGRYQPFPLTDIQQAYWVGRADSIELGGVGAHGYSELRLGEFDEERFTRALNRLVARHDMLRAVFDADGVQRVLQTVPPYRMPCQDLRGLDPASAAAQLDARRDRVSHRVFDAGRWPLFEFAVTRLDGETRLHVSLDGLIVDVASSQILERELARLYAGPDTPLPPLAATFRDYVLAEQALRDTPRYERALRYWRERVADLAPAPGLPLERTPKAVRRPHFVRYDRTVPADQWSVLVAVANARGVTPSVLLLTAFAEVLGRWSREPRFTLSLPLFNRLPLHPDINAVIGDFTSLILVEVDVAGTATFAERARTVQERLWQDIDHAAVSGVRVNRELARARGTAHAAMPIVFNSTLSELAPDTADGGLAAALRAEAVHAITQTPQVWIDHTVLESAGRLYYNWDSLDELFPAGMVAEMFAAYGDLLTRLADPQAWNADAGDLWPAARLAPPAETPPADPPAISPLMHELFDRRARQAPDAPAVLAPGRRIGYGQLRGEARHLAGRLQDRGVRAGHLVAVLADRGWEQVVGTLAVLYAGGAYVPVDPAWPAGRIAHVLERTGARIALVQPAQLGVLELPDGVEAVAVDEAACTGGGPELRPVSGAATDLAYVIYTSGSAGTPKGVMIDHRGAVNTLLDITERFGIGPGDRVLAISSLSFDLSVFDIFGTLSAGAAVVTLDPALARDPAHWLDLAATRRVTVWNSVPALLGLLVEYAEAGHPLPASLRLAMLSGDWIPVALPDRARQLLPDLRVHSLGGATEASIWSIHYPVGEVDPAWRSIPYGTALRHQRIHVLDGALRPRPNWAVGQLYIGGAGLAQGYWRDERTTAASFVTHPVTSERLYRTGDLGRRLPDGTIEFLGREDGQVKIHGYRVELGEIEAALEGHPAVQAAAVRLLGAAQGDKRLAAYLVLAAGSPGEEALIRHLSATLPGYMVPASYTCLDALPLSANGKVDRNRLPEPAAGTGRPAPVPALAGPDEERLVAAVERILGGEPVAPDANLLRLGATSIDIVRICNVLQAELGFRPRLAQFMRQPTLADLLDMYRAHLRERSAAEAAPAAGGPDGGGLVDDPVARATFKARGEGRRVVGHDATTVALSGPADPAAARRYTGYRSVRRFAPVPVDVRDLGALLACLSPREVAGAAKYLYGSAGAAYPVQTYLYVKPGRVAGVPGGAHYYDPHRHRLVQLGRDRVLDPDAYDYFVNRPVFESGAFALFLVAEMAAIEPLYGGQSLGFCQLEAGAMAQLLTMVAVEHGLGLCGIGSVEPAAVAALLELGPTHQPIYSMVGGARPAGAADPPVGAAPGDVDAVTMEDVEI
jgi:amino acid adenylation domain-containing protein